MKQQLHMYAARCAAVQSAASSCWQNHRNSTLKFSSISTVYLTICMFSPVN